MPKVVLSCKFALVIKRCAINCTTMTNKLVGVTSEASSYDNHKLGAHHQNNNSANKSTWVSVMDNYLKTLKSSAVNQKFYEILNESIDLIDRTISEHEPNRWCIAFNGGKDCTALLHLLVCRLLKNYGPDGTNKIKAFYFHSGNAFSAIDDFVEQTKHRYKIEITTLHGNVKEACFNLKRDHPEIEAVFMGTRKFDLIHSSGKSSSVNNSPIVKNSYIIVRDSDDEIPSQQLQQQTNNNKTHHQLGKNNNVRCEISSGNSIIDYKAINRSRTVSSDDDDLELIVKTDPDWPKFLRVYPLLKWDYKFVWDFLLNLQVPYCKLYDEGYTSLGDFGNTVKNEALKYLDQEGNIRYKPAHQLEDYKLERASRVFVEKKKS